MRKHLFLIVDFESTMTQLGADLGMVLCDRSGNIIQTYGFLIKGIYDQPDQHTLFHNEQSADLWKLENLNARYQAYENMLENGSRCMATVGYINNLLCQINAQYKPILTAYNLAFDANIGRNTGVNLDQFSRRFCLWSACISAYATSKPYRKFILDNHLFTNRTALGNMSYRTNAEVMTRFILGNPELPDEPHTGLEDILGYEKPLLDAVCKIKSTKWLLNHVVPYNWRNFQVKDWYKVK